MGVAAPRRVERHAGVLARRARAETAGGARGGDHAPAQRALSVAARRAGECDPRRPIARAARISAGCRSATRAGSGASCMQSASTRSESSATCTRRTRRRPSSCPSSSGRACSSTRLAEPGEARILAGDFNVAQPAPVGYEPGGPGIDHILVADVVAEAPFAWPRERRIVAGRVLSDHAPVERLVGR